MGSFVYILGARNNMWSHDYHSYMFGFLEPHFTILSKRGTLCVIDVTGACFETLTTLPLNKLDIKHLSENLDITKQRKSQRLAFSFEEG